MTSPPQQGRSRTDIPSLFFCATGNQQVKGQGTPDRSCRRLLGRLHPSRLVTLNLPPQVFFVPTFRWRAICDDPPRIACCAMHCFNICWSNPRLDQKGTRRIVCDGDLNLNRGRPTDGIVRLKQRPRTLYVDANKRVPFRIVPRLPSVVNVTDVTLFQARALTRKFLPYEKL